MGADFCSDPPSHGAGALAPDDTQAAGRNTERYKKVSLSGETIPGGRRPPFFFGLLVGADGFLRNRTDQLGEWPPSNAMTELSDRYCQCLISI